MTPQTPRGLSMQPIPSLFAPLAKPLSGAFVASCAPPVSHSDAARPSLPLTVRTAPRQWAYAARFDRTRTTEDEDVRPVVVQVVMEVVAGAVGVGCLNIHKTDFIDEELVGHTSAATRVELVVKDPRSVGSLIVRNASAAGASEARIQAIRCFTLETSEEVVREPALSDPRPTPGWERFYGNRGMTAVEKLRLQEFCALREPVLLRWVDGACLRILPNDQLSRAVFVSGTYEPNTLCALRRLLHPGDVFLDIGANAGVVSLVASRWLGSQGRVYAFEPSEREYARLLDTCALSAADNVTPVRAAVANQSVPVILRVASASHGGLNTLGERFAYDGVEPAGVETVDAVTLDDFVERERIGRVSVIKLDVEGAEGAVLAGGGRVLRQHRPALIVEVFARALAANHWSVSDLEQLLRNATYSLFAIDEQTASLVPIRDLADRGEQNIVALPEARADAVV